MSHMARIRERIDLLAAVNIVFVVAIVLHGADHVRQGTGRLAVEVLAGGAAIAVLGFGTLALTIPRNPRAPLVAAFVGLYTAIGVTASHLLPHWSAFSDPYKDLSLPWYSWGAVFAEIAAALVLAAVGIAMLRRQTRAVPA